MNDNVKKKGRWEWLTTTFIVVLALCIPAGIGLAFYFDNPGWLSMSLVSFIIFFAG